MQAEEGCIVRSMWTTKGKGGLADVRRGGVSLSVITCTPH